MKLLNIKIKPAIIRGINGKGHILWQYKYADSRDAEEVFENLSKKYTKARIEEWLELVKNGKIVKEYYPPC